jgi:hypothetical protein
MRPEGVGRVTLENQYFTSAGGLLLLAQDYQRIHRERAQSWNPGH